MPRMVQVMDFFSDEIDPSAEIFFKHLFLYCLHENEYVLLRPLNVRKRIQNVGNAVRIYAYCYETPIARLMRDAYPSARLSTESHRRFLHHYLPWFYYENIFKMPQTTFLVLIALAMEVVYSLWDNTKFFKQYTQITLYVMASIFSSREFKSRTNLDWIAHFSDYVVEAHSHLLIKAQKSTRNWGYFRRPVTMDYLSEDIPASTYYTPLTPEEIQVWLDRYADRYPMRSANILLELQSSGESQVEIELESSSQGSSNPSLLFRRILPHMQDLYPRIQELGPQIQSLSPRIQEILPRVRRTFMQIPKSLTGIHLKFGRPHS